MASLGVLITYYNEGEKLTRCLESLMHQASPPEEILIYDDASGLPALQFVPEACRAKVLRGDKNLGPGRGRNKLLRETTSEFIHFHDADDLFLHQWSERVREELILKGRDAVFTEISSYDGDKLLTQRVQELTPMRTQDELVRFCLSHAILTSAGTYRTSVVRGMGGYRESLWQSEDYDFHIRLAAGGISFGIISEPLVVRKDVAGRSREREEVWISALDALELLATELATKYLLEVAEASARVGSILFKMGLKKDAHRGFLLARKLGSPKYRDQTLFYRYLASHFGPETAEWAGFFYRTVVPRKIRSWIKK